MNPNRVLGLTPKAQNFYNYLDDHINKNTDKSKFHRVGKYNALTIIFTILFFAGVAGGVALYVFYNRFNNWLLLVGIAAIVFLVLAIVFYNILKNKKKINRSLLTTATPNDIYHKYFEMAFPNSPLKFEGIQHSSLFGGSSSLLFTVNDERVKWTIKEHEEERTWTDSKGNRHTYKVYILRYSLTLSSKSLTGFDDITLTRRTIARAPKSVKDNEFSAASISFNKRYKVTTTGSDKLQMTRLFDPSVIQYFDEMLPLENNPVVKTWNITDGYAYTTWKSGDSKKPWGANLNKFEYFKFTPENYAHKVTERLEKDFERFFSCFYYFRPFDFYKIYQK